VKTTGALLAALAFTLAACSSGGGTAPMSATAAAAATGAAADQALVCHHYMKQRAWVRSLAKPTLADALRMEGYIAADVGQSEGTGKLHTDLQAMLTAMQHTRDVHAASERIYQDCAAIGVTSG